MPWFSDDDSAARGGGPCGPGIRVPGLYARIFEHERVTEPDPRWRFTEAGRRGDPCPPGYGQPRNSLILHALEAGDPVPLPGWCRHLGRAEFPDLGDALPGLAEAIDGLQGQHGKWVVLVVHSDDLVVPVRRPG